MSNDSRAYLQGFLLVVALYAIAIGAWALVYMVRHCI